MHSYNHNIKTFNNATRFLTRVQRALYRDLIEMYYDKEGPIDASDFDDLCIEIMANTEQEKADLAYVLKKFFVLTGGVYTHNYCDEQIEKFRANSTAKSIAGKASAEAKKNRIQQRHNTRSTDVQQNSTNHKPITNNQEPLNSVKGSPKGSRLPTDFELPDEWVQFCEKNRPDLIPKAVFFGFYDYWIAQAGAKGRKADWFATWRNWVRNQKQQINGASYGQPKQPPIDNSAAGRVRAAIARDRAAEAQQRGNQNTMADDVIDVWP
jgi:uncharacterized protein YdaU (DUF1376 family)